MTDLTTCLERSAALQGHTCPRQILGARMGLYAGQLLGIDVPRTDRRLLAFVELDGCFAEAITAATGCSLGRRTLRPVDHGKLAATFIDAATGRAVRLSPGPGVALPAAEHATCPCRPASIDPILGLPLATDLATRCAAPRPPVRDEAIAAYENLPVSELLQAQRVTLTVPLATLLGHDRAHVVCGSCGEEVLSEREVVLLGRRLCRACAGERYFLPAGPIDASHRQPADHQAPDGEPAAGEVRCREQAGARSPFAAVPAYGEATDQSPSHGSRPASGRLVSVG